MRFDCDKRKRAREARKAARKLRERAWHDYYLWWPKRVDGLCVWLETIERRMYEGYTTDYWIYRLKGSTSDKEPPQFALVPFQL